VTVEKWPEGMGFEVSGATPWDPLMNAINANFAMATVLAFQMLLLEIQNGDISILTLFGGPLAFFSLLASAMKYLANAIKGLFGPKVVWPVPDLPHHSNSPFGWRTSRNSWHRGIDINHGGCMYSGAGENGCGVYHQEPIVAVAAGVVKFAGEVDSYGKRIIITHTDGVQTLYAHLHDFLVVQGQTVKVGEPIAIMGNTGDSTGPHLHFDLRPLGGDNNPSIRANALQAYNDSDHRYGYKNPMPYFSCTVCGDKQCKPEDGGSHNFIYNTKFDLAFFRNSNNKKWWEASSSSW